MAKEDEKDVELGEQATEAPKADAPKAEPPKADAPKADSPPPSPKESLKESPKESPKEEGGGGGIAADPAPAKGPGKEEKPAQVPPGDIEEGTGGTAAADAPPAESTVKLTDEGLTVGSIQIAQFRLPLVGMITSALVLLTAVSTWKGPPVWRSDSWEIYAFLFPCVTAAVASFALLMTCMEGFYRRNGKFINLFLFVWNFVGACLLTVVNPFIATGNGYFAAWGTVVFSAGSLGIRSDTFSTSISGLGPIIGLVASSIIVIIASTDFLGPNSFHRYEAIYAMVVSCITLIVFVTFLLEERRKMNLRKTRGEHQGGYGTSIFKIVGLGLFAVLWVALAFVATFRGPFLTTGNGCECFDLLCFGSGSVLGWPSEPFLSSCLHHGLASSRRHPTLVPCLNSTSNGLPFPSLCYVFFLPSSLPTVFVASKILPSGPVRAAPAPPPPRRGGRGARTTSGRREQ